MRTFKTEGIIIKRRDFKDADRILTILTATHGKIAVRASGIRRIPSKRSAHVELLNHATLTLYQGTKFPVLTEAQTISSFSEIKTDLQKIGLAYHLCELVDGLCPENQENLQVFHLLKNTLHELLDAEDPASLVDNFQTELLDKLGYWNRKDFVEKNIDLDRFVEMILERKLKSKTIFSRLH